LSPLNGIKWSELSHAYGFAGDIEPLLKSIYSFPPETESNSEPWYTLWSSLCHQGDIYSASFAATSVIVDALATAPSRATRSFFLLPACVELARVRHRSDIPGDLEKPYFAALSRFPQLVANASLSDQDETASALAAVAVSKGQWTTAQLLVDIEGRDIPEVLAWYHAR
jgi:hypothetical protein